MFHLKCYICTCMTYTVFRSEIIYSTNHTKTWLQNNSIYVKDLPVVFVDEQGSCWLLY